MLAFIQTILNGTSSLLGFTAGPVLQALSDTVLQMLVALFSSLPDGGALPSQMHDAAIYFGNALVKLNFMLPVDVLISCLVIILSLKMSLFGFHIAKWILGFIRGVYVPRFDGYMNVGGETAYSASREARAHFD